MRRVWGYFVNTSKWNTQNSHSSGRGKGGRGWGNVNAKYICVLLLHINASVSK